MPGLLQIAAYARAVISTTGLHATPRDIEARSRPGWPGAILTRPDPPRLVAILDEAVLRREVGGGEIIARQLRHLVDTATAAPNVTILVIPFMAGAHAGTEGPFAIMEFRVEPGAVLLEGKTADLFLEKDDEIAAYQDTASMLAASALDADDSIALIGLVLKEMT